MARTSTSFKKGEGGRPKGSKNKYVLFQEKYMYENLIGSFKSGNYYVYYHINIINNEIFYIGQGHNDRAWDFQARSDKWKKYISIVGNEYDIKIIAANLSQEESLAIERALIKIRNPKCNM